MNDADLLRVLGNRENFNRFRRYVKDHALEKEAQIIIRDLDEYWVTYLTITDIDWDDFAGWFLQVKHFNIKPETAALYKAMFSKIKTGVAGVGLDDLLRHVIKLDFATRIGDLCLKVTENDPKADFDKAGEYYADYVAEMGKFTNGNDLFVTTDLADLVSSTSVSAGLEWPLRELNQSIGYVGKGNLIIVAARPNVGKTTFLAQSATHFARQLPDAPARVIWINNEEPSKNVMMRVYQAALGASRKRIESDIAGAQAAYEKAMGHREIIKIIGDEGAHFTTREIESMLRKYKPDVIIFDTLDKVKGFHNDREDKRLQQTYQWARERAKEYGLVIGTSQLDGQAENVYYVDMSRLADSRTGKQGEADVIITLGMDKDKYGEFGRGLHVPKNKMPGGHPDFEEKNRHGYFELTIMPTISRYKGL